jgi:hypothetical protein
VRIAQQRHPPKPILQPNWIQFDGRRDVGRFLAERVFATPWRLVPIEANAQPAFACYQHGGEQYRLGAVKLVSNFGAAGSRGSPGSSILSYTASSPSRRNFLCRTDESGAGETLYPMGA